MYNQSYRMYSCVHVHLHVSFVVLDVFLCCLGVGPLLKDLMNDIAAAIPAKWRDVGIQLDLPTGILDSIQSQNSREPNPHLRSFDQVFIEWSKKDSESTYTWPHIIAILRKPAVGENSLADKLTAKYC